MKDKSSDDADRNDKDSVPQPLTRIAKEDRQASRESDFGKD
jgi:hypothetical protein